MNHSATQSNHLDRLKEMLTKLDFVRWDRFTHPVSDEYHCYGWIEKPCSKCGGAGFTTDHCGDNSCRMSECSNCPVQNPCDCDEKKWDFVVLTFWDDYEKFWWITSSVKYSKKIGEIVDGDTYEHTDCVRVETLFPDLPNAIKL